MKYRNVMKGLAALTLLLAITPVKAEETNEIQILFTSDLNARLDATTIQVDGENVQVGGYANLAAAIAAYDTENTLVLDAGNYSTGTIYTYADASYAMMASLGYDVVALGEHEFFQDAETIGLALESLEGLTVVQSNVLDAELKKSVAQYTIEEIDGVRIGIFALMDNLSMNNVEGYSFVDALNRGQEVVDQLKAENADYIICLSRGGLQEEKTVSLDHILAQKVDGIDLIISGNNETMLEEIEQENGTWIVSGGRNGMQLGVLRIDLSDDSVNYEAVDVTAQSSSFSTDTYRNDAKKWLSEQGISTQTSVGRTDESLLGNTQVFLADTIGNAYSDLTVHTKKRAIGILPAQYAGVEITSGNLTYEKILDAYGAGSQNDTPSIPLYTAYIKGSDLRTLCEIDHALGALNPMYQMTFGNLYYTYLDDRMAYNQVVDVYTQEATGYWGKISNDTYYPIVSTNAFVSILRQASLYTDGILDIQLYNADGTEVITESFTDEIPQTYKGEDFTLLKAVEQEMRSYPRGADKVYTLNAYSSQSNQKTAVEMSLRNFFIHTSRHVLLNYARVCGTIAGVLIVLKIFLKIWDAFHPEATRFED